MVPIADPPGPHRAAAPSILRTAPLRGMQFHYRDPKMIRKERYEVHPDGRPRLLFGSSSSRQRKL
jgi:hypothetical protein